LFLSERKYIFDVKGTSLRAAIEESSWLSRLTAREMDKYCNAVKKIIRVLSADEEKRENSVEGERSIGVYIHQL
jgi:hypothetical protein